MIDAGFAANRRINLRQQGRRYLDEGNSPLIGRGRETGQIADHTTAQCDDRGTSVTADSQHCVVYRVDGFPGLVLLAVGED